MIVTLVHVWVQKPFVEDFISATVDNHKQSVREPGNLRFDILRDAENPAKFVLYEAYDSEEAAAAHKNTPHYLKWREAVAGWMAQPRRGDKHVVVCPLDKNKW